MNRTLAGLLVVLLGGCTLAWGENARVTVDFSRPENPAPMGGILEGITTHAPSAAKIRPVVSGGEYARHFAYGPYREAAARSRALGYRLIIRLDRYEWFARKWPWQDWPRWEKYVAAQAAYWGPDVIYDVWNEPALPEYWKGTEAQYFETYVRAWRVLAKKFGAKAQVTGPSSQRYDPATIRRFLDYCLAARVQVPILNWHELLDTTPTRVRADLDHARRSFQNHPRYAALGIGKLMINETFPAEDAATTLGLFRALELGGAAGAVNSCFNNDCEKASLSGLLLPDASQRPRSCWFVYQAYAHGVRERVASTSNNPRAIILASRREILLAYDATPTDPETLNLTVALRHLPSKTKIIISRLANSADGPSPGFLPASTEPAAPTLKTTLRRQEVLRLRIDPD